VQAQLELDVHPRAILRLLPMPNTPGRHAKYRPGANPTHLNKKIGGLAMNLSRTTRNYLSPNGGSCFE